MFLARQIRLELSLMGFGSTSVQIFTDLPAVSGGGLALRYATTINAPLLRKVTEGPFRLPGITKGDSLALEIVPSFGCQQIIYGAEIELKLGNGGGAWFWFKIPVVQTPAGWTKLPLPVTPTPNDFSKLALPVRPTPADFTKLPLPVRPTPPDFSKIRLPIEQTDATWRWTDLPVQEDN